MKVTVRGKIADCLIPTQWQMCFLLGLNRPPFFFGKNPAWWQTESHSKSNIYGEPICTWIVSFPYSPDTVQSVFLLFYKFRQNCFASLRRRKRSVMWGEVINSHLQLRLLPSRRWVITLTSVSSTHLCTEIKKKNDTGVKKLPERNIQLLWKQAEVFSRMGKLYSGGF